MIKDDIVALPSRNDKYGVFKIIKGWADYCNGIAMAGIAECLNCNEKFCFHTYTHENITIRRLGKNDVLVLKCNKCGYTE